MSNRSINYRSLLQEALLEMRSLRSQLAQKEQAKTEPIAIVGMACRFPGGANSPEAYWELLRKGVDAITEVPPERWAVDAYYDPDPDTPGKMYTRYGGFINHVDHFDPQFFGISPREAANMDPQQRLLLEVSYTALERAGQCVQELNGSQTGVYVGISFDDYAKFSLNSGDVSRIDAYSSLGNTRSIAVGRLAYALGLQGPTMQLDTTCSSSLLATHLACQSLRSGESNLALAGGVSLMLAPEPTIGFCKLKALAPDGRCKTFDAQANGYVRGEGCGIIVLKRLADAIANGDNILALIRGSAVNHDGQSNGLTAPNGAAQEAVIRQALANAQVNPQQIHYVETHGTGTSLGDPIEVLALGKVLAEGRSKDNPLTIGSVKTNIGHLEAAAGVASLIKVVLALQHQQIPPHLHFQQPNPHIPWERLPVTIPTELTPWSADERFAGISSFGMSGTNAHVVLEGRKIERDPNQTLDTLERPLHILTLSAKSPQALEQLVSQYQEYLRSPAEAQRRREMRGGDSCIPEAITDDSFADICFSANTGRSHFQHRLSVIAASTEDALAKFGDRHSPSIFTGTASPNQRPKIAFLFTGQGSQYVEMSKQLYQTQPTFKEAIDRCANILEPYLETPFLNILSPDLKIGLDTPSTLFALEYALYQLWTAWGVTPDVMLGVEIGEYVAATVAGIWRLEDALKLVAHRDRPAAFAAVANSLDYSSPQVEIVSSRKGIAGSQMATASYWCRPSPSTELVTGIQTIAELGCQIGIEIGASSLLQQASSSEILWLPSLAGDEQSQAADLPYPPSCLHTMLSSLAQLYGQGVNINWRGFEGGDRRHRVLLPTYPFQRQRYWIDPPPHPSSRIESNNVHPLLGQQIAIANSETLLFENQMSQVCPAYLQQHQVFGMPIMPASGYVEMALAAAAKVYRTNNLALTDVAIQKALVLTEVPTTVQLILTPTNSQAEGTSKEYKFEIFSQSIGSVSDSVTQQSNSWTLHASGKVAIASNLSPFNLLEKQAECNQPVEVEKFYQAYQEHGIKYGKKFQIIDQLWNSKKAALGKISLPQKWANSIYKLHPILLDASLQIVGAALAENQTYLPIGINNFTFSGTTSNQLWSYVQLRDHNHSSVMMADVQLVEPNGRKVAQIAGLQLRKANLVTESSKEDWLYRVEWREQALSHPSSSPNWLFFPEEISKQVISLLPQLANQPELAAYRQLLPELEALSIAYVLKAFADLGWQFLENNRFTTAAVIQKLQIVPQYERLLSRLLTMLAEVGILTLEDRQWQVIRQPRTSELVIPYQRLLDDSVGSSELTLLHRCGSNLASVLRGEVKGVELLFPEGDLSTLTQLYQDSPGATLMNRMIQQVVRAAIPQKRDRQKVRILEIGAGTGGTTAYLLPHLDADNTEYTFSDVSPLFITKAQQRFSDYDFVTYELLDIDQTPRKNLPSFDIIIAANVLHATQDIQKTLDNVKALLAPDGMLVLLEGTRSLRWLDLIFGVSEGWWRFTDTELRPEHPLLSVSQWQEVLQTCGFEQPTPITLANDADFNQQAVIVARRHSQKEIGSWLLLGDRLGIGKELARQLHNRGDKCILVDCGDKYEQHSENEFSICPTSEDFLELIHTQTHQFRGIVHLWSLDGTTDILNSQALETDLHRSCGSALSLIQALLTANHSINTPLYLVTQNAQAVGNDLVLGLAQSSLWGIAKVGALETDFQFKSIDLDSKLTVSAQAQALLAELLAKSEEEQIALRGDRRYVARLTRFPSGDLMNGGRSHAEAQRRTQMRGTNRFSIPTIDETTSNHPSALTHLTISQRGSLENLEFHPLVRKEPAADEVEIRVEATGVNFRDILNALGLYPGEAGALGCECAGEIVTLGSGVKDLKLGERVIAIASNSFSEYVTVNRAMVVPKPAHLTSEEAATIGVTFLTAHYGLHQLARISPGDKVLIHSGAGGVGQAAIQIAHQAGAEVFATASQGKWEALHSMGVKHVFNSRTLEFAEEIMALTQGKGVDIVLNSLSGEFRDRSLSLLKPNGRFVELGKPQDRHPHRSPLNGAYFSVDLVALCHQQPELIQTMLRQLMFQFESNQLQPLPYTIFPFAQAVDAFRYMQQAKHIGKVVISQSQPSSQNASFSLTNYPSASYLITGGLGGLGLLFAQWLVKQGARNLVLLSRRQAKGETQQRIQALEQAGAKVTVAQVDVTNEQQVAQLLTSIKSSLPPLRGVIHGAGVLDDGVLQTMSWEKFTHVVYSKVLGAWNLHTLTQDCPLDFFVLFSSATALLGSPGQSNHVCANLFLDTLAHYRQQIGQPGLSINWGIWSEVGSAAQRDTNWARQKGVGAIAPEDGIDLFAELVQSNAPQIGVVPIDWAQFLRQGVSSPFFADFVSQGQPEPEKAEYLELLQANPSQHRDLLENHLRSQIAQVLGFHPDEIDPRKGFFDLGLDSLTSVELKNRLQTSLGISLPSTVIFDRPTLTALADYLVDKIGLGDEEKPAAAETTELSEAEIADLLAQELREIERGKL